ncbi:phosphatase PAP2 family protein [candidate division KSB1 bacterium]
MQEKSIDEPAYMQPVHVPKNHWLCCGIVFVATWGIALVLWAQAAVDRSILFALNCSHFSEIFVSGMQLFSGYGMPAIVFVYLCYIVLSFRISALKDGRKIFLLIIFSFAVAGISGDLLKEVFDRTRPLFEYPGELRFLTGSKTPSFPSGHATKSVAFVLPFIFYADYKKGLHTAVKYLLAVIALLVCISRIVLGAHYLSDVLAGAGLAFLCLQVSVLVSNKLLTKFPVDKFEHRFRIYIAIYLGLIVLLMML